ncbi:hypothetical protein [Acuticoccus mangrovi]|uniref:Uncharacterized protein n=1 Tax=Acuticoccus mangrovi TaxID=2796142 RepID=A0A934IIZ5_9HYPH|nr:hypothetical protein [Acuticoccus mangrovi]MBJ3775861.1 hypothetical protein [Acuticoccus mangrovi]
MHVSYADNIAEVDALLTEVQRKQLPFITSVALNKAAFEGRADLRAEMERVFDRPRPYTLNSTYVDKATKARLEAAVFFKDMGRGVPAGKYLRAQVWGGERRNKRFEGALRARGILGSGEFAVPARDYPRDANGDIRSSVVTKILSQLGAFTEVGYVANATARSRKRNAKRSTFFASRAPHMAPGIYERTGPRSINAVFIFVEGATYRPRLEMERVLQESADRTFGPAFEAAFEDAFGFSGAGGLPF